MNDIIAAHRALYDAIETGDADLMTALWVDSPAVSCVHPAAPIVRGADQVVRSWMALMAQMSYIQFFLTDVEVAVVERSDGQPTTAIVTCVESVLSDVGGNVGSDAHPGSFTAGSAASTSILVKDASGWKFWARHAGPLAVGGS